MRFLEYTYNKYVVNKDNLSNSIYKNIEKYNIISSSVISMFGIAGMYKMTHNDSFSLVYSIFAWTGITSALNHAISSIEFKTESPVIKIIKRVALTDIYGMCLALIMGNRGLALLMVDNANYSAIINLFTAFILIMNGVFFNYFGQNNPVYKDEFENTIFGFSYLILVGQIAYLYKIKKANISSIIGIMTTLFAFIFWFIAEGICNNNSDGHSLFNKKYEFIGHLKKTDKNISMFFGYLYHKYKIKGDTIFKYWKLFAILQPHAFCWHIFMPFGFYLIGNGLNIDVQ